jgi:ribosomal protein L11 methyltransferase
MDEKYYYLLEVKYKGISEGDYFEINNLAFGSYGCQGVEEFNLNEAAVDEILGKEALLGAEVNEYIINKIEKSVSSGKLLTINYLFFEEADAKSFQDYLGSLKNKPTCDLKRKIYEDWNLEWKKHYKRIDISPRLKIVPQWEGKENLDGEILINPGMGFGTGSHETTYLCLKFLDELSNAPKKCLDMGCGSGILGIAAIKLFNSKVDFVDVSKEALANCYENLLLNFKEESLEGSSIILRERFSSKREYDLIFANILEVILLSEKDFILSCLIPKGKLIISGLLNEQRDDFLVKFNSAGNLKILETKSQGDWCAILLESL